MDYQLIKSSIPQKEELSAVERVLTNRGIKKEDITHYLNTSDNDILDPCLVDNMMEGATLLAQHIANNHLIMIQIDSDCDGDVSAAALLNYLYCLFPSYVQNNIIYRFHNGKEHGIIENTVPEGVKLVIAPDSSSNDYDVHEKLKERGIDVLVIDHHEAERVSENAIVINNQLCNYPTKSLSGVGMVYKFCQYFDSIMNTDYADYILDLVALGMIADMMDMRDFETKHLITRGLEDIRNPFFASMVEKNAFQLKEITPIGVAFYVAPYVNATIRMGSPEEKRIMFESMLDFKAYKEIPSTKRGCKGQMEKVVEQAVRNCTNIKNRQTKARDTGVDIIERLIKENNLLNNKILIIQIPSTAHIEKNLTGLIANQLMAKYQRPVLLLNETLQEGEKCWEGSARGYDKSSLQDFRQFCNNSGLNLYAEGHANAFGFGIKDIYVNMFIHYCNTTLKDFEFTPCYYVDFIFNADNFNGNDIIEIAELKSLWGQGIEEPYIALTNIKVSKNNITLMSADKNPTLKITLQNGTSLIKFKSSQEEYDKLATEGFLLIDIVGRCERNAWNGRITPQIMIEDYEITNSVKYYF